MIKAEISLVERPSYGENSSVTTAIFRYFKDDIHKTEMTDLSLVERMEGKSENIITHSFDLTEISRYRRNWGVYRDRRPDLYEGILSLDGNQTNKTDYA